MWKLSDMSEMLNKGIKKNYNLSEHPAGDRSFSSIGELFSNSTSPTPQAVRQVGIPGVRAHSACQITVKHLTSSEFIIP
jgi:hypothetical protein